MNGNTCQNKTFKNTQLNSLCAKWIEYFYNPNGKFKMTKNTSRKPHVGCNFRTRGAVMKTDDKNTKIVGNKKIKKIVLCLKFLFEFLKNVFERNFLSLHLRDITS